MTAEYSIDQCSNAFSKNKTKTNSPCIKYKILDVNRIKNSMFRQRKNVFQTYSTARSI